MSTWKSPITCHVLDSSIGKPAAGVRVELQDVEVCTTFELRATGRGTSVQRSVPIMMFLSQTDADGRCMNFSTDSSPVQWTLGKGLYKITFQTKEYFERSGRQSFYPVVEITFAVTDPDEHYHIPLLISPFSYTTYRGS